MTDQQKNQIAEEEKYRKYQQKKMSLKEYLELKEKKEKRKKIRIPLAVKIFLLTPFVIIFCFGVFFIPFIIHSVRTGVEKNDYEVANPKADIKTETDLRKK